MAVVDENLKTLYHTYVKPDLAISDYLTRYSGITEELLLDVKKTPSDVQQDLRNLLPPDAILVGQSLQSDLKALKVWCYLTKKSLFFFANLRNIVMELLNSCYLTDVSSVHHRHFRDFQYDRHAFLQKQTQSVGGFILWPLHSGFFRWS